MNIELKNLIKACKPYELGTPFRSFLVVPIGKPAENFYETKRYSGITLVLETRTDKGNFVLGLDNATDLLTFFGKNKKMATFFNMEYDLKYKAFRIFVASDYNKFIIDSVGSAYYVELKTYGQ